MIQKIKELFSNIAAIVVALLVGLGALLVYTLGSRKKEVDSLKAQLDLIDTQRKADLLEAQIKERMANKDVLDYETKELQKSLDQLQIKREEIAQKEKNKNSDEVEDFWRNN